MRLERKVVSQFFKKVTFANTALITVRPTTPDSNPIREHLPEKSEMFPESAGTISV